MGGEGGRERGGIESFDSADGAVGTDDPWLGADGPFSSFGFGCSIVEPTDC